MPIPTQAPALAGAVDTTNKIPLTAVTSTAEAPPVAPHLSDMELKLSSYLLIFALLIVIVEAIIIKVSSIGNEGAIRLLTVTLILISILFLTTAGYGSQQITAATGLLGTIAGYLLGRNSGRTQQDTTTQNT